jgi:hypothetical protein
MRPTTGSGKARTPVPDGSEDPDLPEEGSAIIAYATSQPLETGPTSVGTNLQIVTEYPDEGGEAFQNQFLENGFNLAGNYSRDTGYALDGEGSVTLECGVDFGTDGIIDDGNRRSLALLARMT